MEAALRHPAFTVALLAVLASGLALPAAAQAHATLLGSSPEAGSVVAKPPPEVVLRFDQEIQPVAGGTDVVNAANQSVLGGSPHNAPSDVRKLVIPLKPRLPHGDYTVRWRIVSTDGHIVSGVLAFGVGVGQPPPQAASTESSPVDYPYLIARFAYFTGLMLLIGGAVYRLAVFAPVLRTMPEERREMAELRESHRATQLFTLAAVLLLGGGWIALTRQGSEVAGVSFWEAFDHRGPVGSALQATRFGRVFGRGIDVAAVLVVLVAASSGVVRRSRTAAILIGIPAAALAIWAVVVPGLSGHAGDPGEGTLTVIVDALHVAAAAIWIGGVAQLVWVTPHATRGLTGQAQRAARSAIVRRFSTIALGCVVVVAVTGFARALWEVSAVSQIWTTSYGQTLVAKTLLFAGLIGLGYRNRGVLDRFPEIRRGASVELVLMAGLLGAVTLLTNLPPANLPSVPSFASAAPAPGKPNQLALAGGVRLDLWPGTAGPNWVAVKAPGHRSRVTLVLQPSRGAGSAVVLRRSGGMYTGLAQNVPAGSITAQISSGSRVTGATVTVGARTGVLPPPPPPHGLGAVAAEEASDLAVGLQRLGSDRAQVTLIGQTGAGVPDALVTVDGSAALPCARVPACYTATVPTAGRTLNVRIRRPGVGPVHTSIALPPATAPLDPAALARAAHAYRSLASVRSLQILASDPKHSVTTTFISEAPDRLSIDVHGGEQSILIGSTRWDENPNGTWAKTPISPSRLPDAFWAPNATAVHIAARRGRLEQLTLVNPSGPTFFRLWVDPRTHLVQHLRMITAAHFMTEFEGDFNSEPKIHPPT
jgi:copper transport protein